MSHKEQQRLSLITTSYGSLEAEVVDEIVFIHLEIREWTPSKYKKMKYYWQVVLLSLKNKGIDDIYTVIPDGDDKLYKFQTMFGFKEYSRQGGTILFNRST